MNVCYCGRPAGLGVAARLRAGVFTQPVTLVPLGRLLTTGGPHCALHLVLHVPVAALATERKRREDEKLKSLDREEEVMGSCYVSCRSV